MTIDSQPGKNVAKQPCVVSLYPPLFPRSLGITVGAWGGDLVGWKEAHRCGVMAFGGDQGASAGWGG